MYKYLALFIVTAMFFSCSSAKKTQKENTEMKIKKDLKTNEKTQTTKIYFLEDPKKYPSITKNPQITQTDKIKADKNQLYTKEYDFNNDGKTDMIIVYNDKGQIDKIYSDLDQDLKHDAIDYYKNGRIDKRVLLNYITQKPYIIIQYDSNNNIVTIKTDANLDGKIDRKSLYKDGKLYQIQTDTNGDGKFNMVKEIKTQKNNEDEGGK